MAIRTINYTVNANGIIPPTLQSGGMQGEHRATELVFNLTAEFVDSLIANADGAELMYRIEGHTGAGVKNSTEAAMFGADAYAPIRYPLENWLTRDGGSIRVYLIISILKDDETLLDIYSFPALIRLNGVPDAPFTDGENYESLTLLSESARVAAKTAKESAECALYNAERTEDAKASLESGAEFIFLGGDASAALDIDLVIDEKVNELSPNPVKNSAIKEYIDDKIEDLDIDDKIDINSFDKSSVFVTKLLDCIYPVGSYYWSSVNTDPSTLFGGTWVPVKDRFILAAGDDYEAGNVGGESSHYHLLGENGYALIGQSLKDPTGLAYHNTNVGGSYGQTATHRVQCSGLTAASDDEQIGLVTQLGGSTEYANNMPPYEVAYCWKRIP